MKLRIKVQTLYEGEGAILGASNIHTLIGQGVPVREWNVPLHAEKAAKNKNKLTKVGQDHELACWCADSDEGVHDEYRNYLKEFNKRTTDRLDRLEYFLNRKTLVYWCWTSSC